MTPYTPFISNKKQRISSPGYKLLVNAATEEEKFSEEKNWNLGGPETFSVPKQNLFSRVEEGNYSWWLQLKWFKIISP